MFGKIVWVLFVYLDGFVSRVKTADGISDLGCHDQTRLLAPMKYKFM